MSPLFLVELRKYKQVVEYLEKQNAERHNNALLFFHRGVKEGFFRSDLNFDIILKTSSASVNYAMETQMYKTTALLPSCTTQYSFICAASAQRKA